MYSESVLNFSEVSDTSSDKKLHILLVEDDANDEALIKFELQKAGIPFDIQRIETKEDLISELYIKLPDIMLADYALPRLSGIEALTLLRKFDEEIPFILVTGIQSQEIAVECMKEGADDYILKSTLIRLPGAIENALKNAGIKKEKKRIEQALKRSEENYKLITDNSRDLICMLDIQGNYIYISPSYKEILGYTSEDLIGKSFFKYIHEDDESYVREKWFNGLQEKNDQKFEYRYKNIHGDWSVFEASGNSINSDTGIPFKSVLVSRDISERKEFEEHMLLLANSIESTTELISITDYNNRLMFVNRAFLEKYKYTREEVIGQPPSILHSALNPPHTMEDIIQGTRNGGWKGELINKDKFGNEFPILLSTNELRNKNNEFIGSIRISVDLTESKKAEEEIKNSLKEKEIILKEIHHRVKNNLQVISSIFYLQAEKVQDKKLHDILDECKDRVRTMALIHENFYQSDDLTRINFKEYIRNLVSNLIISYGIDSEKISVDVDISDVLLSIDVAIPCGLIINELVSNCYKHAFPDKKRGHIKIFMAGDGDKNYTMAVKDNGVGFPESINFRESKTLGIELILTLAEQIEGKVGIKNNNGTEVKIKFKA